jgi:phage terminase small subunit
MKGLNKRQEAYCYWRARAFSMEESMPKAGYRCRGVSARNVGSKLEENVYIRERIERERLTIFDKNSITEEYILEGLKKIAEQGEQEANRVRAFELLGKTRAMFTDKQLQVKDISSQERQERIDKLKNYFATDGSIQPQNTRLDTITPPKNVQP